MNTESIRQIRNILFRTLVCTAVLTWLMQAVTFAFWDTWTGLTSQLFRIGTDGLGETLLNFFLYVKFYAIFILLAPALALHWTLKSQPK